MSAEITKGIYEKFARDTGIMIFVHIITALRSVILLPIIAKTLDASSYGIWAQVSVTLLLVFPLCTLGMDYALNRFLPHKTDREEIGEIFFSAIAVVLGCSVVITAVILLLRNQIADTLFGDISMVSVVVLMAATLLFRAVASVCTNYFRAFRQTKTYATLSVALVVAEIGLVSYLVLVGYGILGAVFALLIIRVLIFIVGVGLIIRQVGVRAPHFINMRAYLGFSIPLMILPLIWWVLSWSDRYIIAIFLDTAQVGIYSAAYIIGSACAVYLGPLTDLMLAALSKLYEERKIAEVKTILSHSLKYLVMLVIPSAFGVSVIGMPLLLLFTTVEFAIVNPAVIPLIASAAAIFAVSSIMVYSLQLTKRTRLIALVWLTAALANLGLNFALIPWVGILGAAISTFFSFAFASVIVSYFSLKSLSFVIDWLFIIKSIIASGVMSVVLCFVAPTGWLGVILWIIAGASIYFIALFLLRGLTIDEIKSLAGLFKRALLR
ncbi:oligosaccharide flippase family protein [Chloroflexota bacterium]